MVQLSYLYMTTGRTIALSRQTFVAKVMFLLFNMLSTLVITFLPRSKVKSLSCVRLFATPWTVAHQAPPSVGFSKQEYWSGVPLNRDITLPIKVHLVKAMVFLVVMYGCESLTIKADC